MSLDPVGSKLLEVKLRRLRVGNDGDSSLLSSVDSSFDVGSSGGGDIPVESRPASRGGRARVRREGFEGDGFGDGVCRRKKKNGSVRCWEDGMNQKGEGRTVDNERG